MTDDGPPRLRRDQLFGSDPVRGGPAAGERFPPFDMATTDGPRIRSRDLAGRPALIALASCTCPIAARAGPLLRWLYGAFGDRVSFLTVYVREARPSRRYMQPTTFEQKFAFANDYRMRHHIPWALAVDDIEGTLERALGGGPSPVYLLDRNGRVARSVAESSDAVQLRRGLDDVLSRRRPGTSERPAAVHHATPAAIDESEPARVPLLVLPPSALEIPSSPPVAARAVPVSLRRPTAASLGTGALMVGALALAAGWVAWRLLDPDR